MECWDAGCQCDAVQQVRADHNFNLVTRLQRLDQHLNERAALLQLVGISCSSMCVSCLSSSHWA